MENENSITVNLESMFLTLGYTAKGWKSQKSRLYKACFSAEAGEVFNVSPVEAETMLKKLTLGKSKYRDNALDLLGELKKSPDMFNTVYEPPAPSENGGSKKKVLKTDLETSLRKIGEIADYCTSRDDISLEDLQGFFNKVNDLVGEVQ